MSVVDFPTPPAAGGEPPAELPCPVVALGQHAGHYWFASRLGEVRTIGYRDFTPNGLGSLFDGDDSWLWARFPRTNRQDQVIGFNAQRAGAFLMKACAEAGQYDPSTPVRGPGVWPGAVGGLVGHWGDTIERISDGGSSLSRPGLIDGVFYTRAPALTPPSRTPAAVDTGRLLAKAVASWHWAEPWMPDLLVGWLGAALLGAAPGWRAHVLIQGGHGTGKSKLTELAKAVLGDAAHTLMTDATEAGLRQQMTGQARALLLDEAEERPEGGPVVAILRLIRQMSGGAGAKSLKGSSEGVAKSYSVNGPAWLAAINPPPLLPQDQSRITVLTLLQLGDRAAGGHIDSAIRMLATASPGLRRRAMAGVERFRADRQRWREALVAAGCSPRLADQMSTLAAGRDLLMEDTPRDAAEMGDAAALWAPAWEAAREDAAEADEATLCLRHLYTAMPDVWRSGERRTVAQLVMRAARGAVEGEDERKLLVSIGLRVQGKVGDPHLPATLSVATSHQGLSRLFAGSTWASGSWAATLLRHPSGGVTKAPGKVRFAGLALRAVVVPQALLPTEKDDD